MSEQFLENENYLNEDAEHQNFGLGKLKLRLSLNGSSTSKFGIEFRICKFLKCLKAGSYQEPKIQTRSPRQWKNHKAINLDRLDSSIESDRFQTANL